MVWGRAQHRAWLQEVCVCVYVSKFLLMLLLPSLSPPGVCVGATVYMVCRNKERGEATKQQIIDISGNEVEFQKSNPWLF